MFAKCIADEKEKADYSLPSQRCSHLPVTPVRGSVAELCLRLGAAHCTGLGTGIVRALLHLPWAGTTLHLSTGMNIPVWLLHLCHGKIPTTQPDSLGYFMASKRVMSLSSQCTSATQFLVAAICNAPSESVTGQLWQVAYHIDINVI